MLSDVGILSAVVHVPANRVSVVDEFDAEGIRLTRAIEERLGTRFVHVCNKEGVAEMALAASREALSLACLSPDEVDVIIDYSTLPQHFLVPAWNMSNMLQHELGATKAFTLGFSGGGATNFLVALKTATDLINQDDDVTTALLVGEDRALSNNRILSPEKPLTMLGDGASAVIVKGGVSDRCILGNALFSDAAYHDACYIPGGALAFPDNPELYRLELDTRRFENSPRWDVLDILCSKLLDQSGLTSRDISKYIYPNFSASDRTEFAQSFHLRDDQFTTIPDAGHGHMFGHDLVLNYDGAISSGTLHTGDFHFLCSHGMGYMYGATLMQF